ncbi:hypothetical protein ALC57_15075, partial [Trachymyrmex cornetzi]
MGHQRAVPQLTPCTITEPIVISVTKNILENMADHCANVEDMDGVNMAKLFEAMEVEFEDMVDDTECRADVSDNNADHAEKFVQSSKIRALTSRTKHCIISCYYTERCNDASTYCAMCMVELRNVFDKGMYLVRNHKECSFYALDFRWSCHECGEKMYIVYPCDVCPFCTHEETIEKSSNDTECLVRLDHGNIDRVVKFVQPSEIEALNIYTDHCIINCYYRTRECKCSVEEKKTWKITSEWNANCWSSATRSLLWVNTQVVGGGSRPSVEKQKCGEGAVKKLPANKEPPISTRTRRATSVPAEKSEDTARRERVSPNPSCHIENYISLLSSDEESTQFQPSGVRRLMLRRKKSTGPPPKTTSNEGVVTRSRRPATSLPTTLTTCTVTTTTCGNPITSTGFTGGVGRQLTPSTCLPQRNILPTIGEERTSPCVAVTTPPIGGFNTSPLIQSGPSTPEPERGLEERRQEGAASKTIITEVDNQWGGQWTVSVGRKAKSRL